mgnify:CR=1 FL=1
MRRACLATPFSSPSFFLVLPGQHILESHEVDEVAELRRGVPEEHAAPVTVRRELQARERVLDATDSLLCLADKHADSLASYYTHHIRAEPITIGYYFSSRA